MAAGHRGDIELRPAGGPERGGELLGRHRIGTAHGGVFAASLAAYTLLRQGILGLRAEPRLSFIGPPLTAAAAVGVIAADILVHAIGVLHLPVGA